MHKHIDIEFPYHQTIDITDTDVRITRGSNFKSKTSFTDEDAETRFLIKDIKSIDWKKSGFSNGYVRFVRHNTTLDPQSDPYSFEFSSKSKKIKDIVEDLKEYFNLPDFVEDNSALDSIKQQLIDAKVGDLFGTKKEVKYLPEVLKNDEVIQYATSGIIDGNTVLVVLTQKRVLFVDKGLLYGVKSTEIPLDMVNGVSYSTGLMLGQISVTNGSITTLISDVSKNTAPIMTGKIKELSEKYKLSLRAPQISEKHSNESNEIEQLRKYKQLFDEGVLTQEEFTAKKKQILNI